MDLNIPHAEQKDSFFSVTKMTAFPPMLNTTMQRWPKKQTCMLHTQVPRPTTSTCWDVINTGHSESHWSLLLQRNSSDIEEPPQVSKNSQRISNSRQFLMIRVPSSWKRIKLEKSFSAQAKFTLISKRKERKRDTTTLPSSELKVFAHSHSGKRLQPWNNIQMHLWPGHRKSLKTPVVIPMLYQESEMFWNISVAKRKSGMLEDQSWELQPSVTQKPITISLQTFSRTLSSEVYAFFDQNEKKYI